MSHDLPPPSPRLHIYFESVIQERKSILKFVSFGLAPHPEQGMTAYGHGFGKIAKIWSLSLHGLFRHTRFEARTKTHVELGNGMVSGILNRQGLRKSGSKRDCGVRQGYPDTNILSRNRFLTTGDQECIYILVARHSEPRITNGNSHGWSWVAFGKERWIRREHDIFAISFSYLFSTSAGRPRRMIYLLL